MDLVSIVLVSALSISFCLNFIVIVLKCMFVILSNQPMFVSCSGSAGYCFVEMSDEPSVDRCVHRLNGKLVPASNPVSMIITRSFIFE